MVVLALLAAAGCSATVPAGAPVALGSTASTPSGPAVALAGYGGTGNTGYDVGAYALRLRLQPARNQLSGTATITAAATAVLHSLTFDLQRGLRASSVTVNGQAAKSRSAGDKLVVVPAVPIAANQSFTVVVEYQGSPGLGEKTPARTGWHRTGRRSAYVAGLTASARSWFPVDERPGDKATFDLEMTVPKGLTVVSSGLPGGHTTRDGLTVWRWRESEPMSPSFAFLAVGDYELATWTHAGSKMITALPRSAPERAARAIARTPEIADWLAGRLGPWPFKSYGSVVLDDVDGKTSITGQGRMGYDAGSVSEKTIARALGQQYFGASVTPADWRDMWLTEGFATYVEWMWTEQAGGDSADFTMREEYATYPWQSLPAVGSGEGVLQTTGPRIRGAMTLHALRQRVGDATFFEVLRAWAAERAHGTGTTEEFVATAERVSGRDLDGFFDVWLRGAYRPAV